MVWDHFRACGVYLSCGRDDLPLRPNANSFIIQAGHWGLGSRPLPPEKPPGPAFFLNPTSWQNPNSSSSSLSKDQGEKQTKKREETTSKIRVMKSERKKGEAKNLNPDSLLPDGAPVAKPFLVSGPSPGCPAPAPSQCCTCLCPLRLSPGILWRWSPAQGRGRL